MFLASGICKAIVDYLDTWEFWQWLMLVRIICFLAVILLLKLISSDKKIKPAVLIVVILAFLLVPNRMTVKDGGSKMYWSPLYEVIVWNQLDNYDENNNIIPGRHDTEVFIFPFNRNWFEDGKN